MKARLSKKSPTLKNLAKEVSLLRSFVISMAEQDGEGVYRPQFVKEMLSAAAETPRRELLNSREFLRRIKQRA